MAKSLGEVGFCYSLVHFVWQIFVDDCLGQDKSTECDYLWFVWKAVDLDCVVCVAEACLVWQFPFFYLPHVFIKMNKNCLNSKKCK